MSPEMSRRILLALLLALSPLALALSTDREQPVEIEADSVDINEAEGISRYQGEVVIRQGSLYLTADQVTVHHQGRAPARMVAEGTPVRFRQQPDDQALPVQGEARRAEYTIDSEELLLTGDAELAQGEDRFRSDRIVYDRVRAVVKAGRAAQGAERVRITIQPQRAP